MNRGIELYLLNRRTTPAELPDGVKVIHADIHDEAKAAAALAGKTFDAVVDFVAYGVADVERDLRLFAGKTGQYIFISSASAYQKPQTHYIMTESTPLANPFWEYSRNKIKCEERLMVEYREKNFPMVIVRPSLTYGDTQIPLSIAPWKQSWTVVERMLKGKPIIIHGDGTGLQVTTQNTDFAKGLVGLLGDVRAIGHAFHITTDEVLTWNQQYEIVAAAAGAKPTFVHVASETLAAYDANHIGGLIGDKMYSSVYDNSKIKLFVPDFAATMTFQRGIERTVRHIRAHPHLQAIDPAFDPWCDRVIADVEKLRAGK
jgi:nucleoside-diphosphate-sugar epimerase